MAVYRPAKWYVVCDTHGVRDHSGRGLLSVSRPITRKERRGGCPICARISAQMALAAKEAALV